ncbi:MAG: hypothetical protein IIA61_05060 [Candidatus Marinimicrobia bacterium]|nr:hypothetical protein [Candidatus Neomarinimicrobiota bacterium]
MKEHSSAALRIWNNGIMGFGLLCQRHSFGGTVGRLHMQYSLSADSPFVVLRRMDIQATSIIPFTSVNCRNSLPDGRQARR